MATFFVFSKYYFFFNFLSLTVIPPNLRCVYATPLFRNALFYSGVENFRSGFVFVVQIPYQNKNGGVQHIAGRLAFDRANFITSNNLHYPTTAPQIFETFKAGEEQFATSEPSSFVVTHVLRVRKELGKSQCIYSAISWYYKSHRIRIYCF